MDEPAERRRYYPDEENVPLSDAVRQAIEDHEDSSFSTDELKLFDQINPGAIDMLFSDTAGPEVSVQIRLTNVTVSIWSDGGIDIRVTEKIE